jgi:hypothetical protein
LVFAFVDTVIAAVGVAQSYCWESPKPAAFGTRGEYWGNVGWKVRVQFTPLVHRVRPKDHMGVLRPLLPERYAPLQPNGNGIQSVYLTRLPEEFAETRAGLIGAEAQNLIGSVSLGAPMQANDDLTTGSTRSKPESKRILHPAHGSGGDNPRPPWPGSA